MYLTVLGMSAVPENSNCILEQVVAEIRDLNCLWGRGGGSRGEGFNDVWISEYGII